MNEIREKKRFYFFMREQSWAEAFCAALFSVLVTMGIAGLIKERLYESIPLYQELSAGITLWDGYDKQGDMSLFYLILFLLPCFYLIFAIMFRFIFKNRKKADAKKTVWDVSEIRFFWKKEKVKTWFWRVAAVLQLLLPLQLLLYYRFYYHYENVDGIMQLFYSGRWKLCCLMLLVLFIAFTAFELCRKKERICLTTLILVAMSRVLMTPEGICRVDFFHNGEMTVPMQQLLSYGKLPYKELIPIHGFCDYFYGIFNYGLFDGSYLSNSAAVMVSGLLMAAIYAVIIGSLYKNRMVSLILIYLFMPFLIETAGVRYLFFFCGFLILMSDWARRDSLRFIWLWIMGCILAISWNVSIGSAFAVAFLPEFLVRFFTDGVKTVKDYKNWDKKYSMKLAVSYVILLITGIAFIPLFLKIITYLGDNAGTTTWVNGMAVFGEDYSFVNTFALFLPLLLFLVFALKDGWKEKAGECNISCKGRQYHKELWMFVSLFAALLVIANYAFVRYDAALRTKVLAVFFLFMFLLISVERLAENMDYLRMGCLLGGLFLCVSIMGISDSFFPGDFLKAEHVPAETELTVMGKKVMDPIVYVDGADVGMKNLGRGFINGNELNSLKNVKTVLDQFAPDGRYLDLTNQVANYMVFDAQTVLPYTSGYNISNKRMQEQAVKMVEEQSPRLILLAPTITFDEAPFSIRSLYMYDCLLEMGYEPQVYENVIFLLLNGAQNEAGREAVSSLYHKEQMGMLPQIWGKAMNRSETVINGEFGLTELACSPAVSSNQESGTRCEIVLDQPKAGTDISLIQIGVLKKDILQDTLQFCFKDAAGNERSFHFAYKNEDNDEDMVYFTIPVGSSPYWQYSEISGFTLDGIKQIKNTNFFSVIQ